MIKEVFKKTRMTLEGNIIKDQFGFKRVSNFSVWVDIAGNEINVTNSLNVDQLSDAKEKFIEEYEMFEEQLEEDFFSHEVACGG